MPSTEPCVPIPWFSKPLLQGRGYPELQGDLGNFGEFQALMTLPSSLNSSLFTSRHPPVLTAVSEHSRGGHSRGSSHLNFPPFPQSDFSPTSAQRVEGIFAPVNTLRRWLPAN